MFFIAVFAVSSFYWKSEDLRFMPCKSTAMFPNMFALMNAPITMQQVQTAIYKQRDSSKRAHVLPYL